MLDNSGQNVKSQLHPQLSNFSLEQIEEVHRLHNLSLRELEEEFNHDLNVIARNLKKLPESERQHLIDVLSGHIVFYLTKKVEIELDKSLSKVL